MKLTLREWRRLKEVSQEQMAEVCGININTYRAWEEKPSSFRLSCAMKAAERLGISLDDIILEP